MGVAGGANIHITDGLVFLFDGANNRCHSSGSEATDLSGQNSGTIDAGVSGRFRTQNKGYIVFDGFTHSLYWDATSDQQSSQMTLSAWLNFDTVGANDLIARTETDLTGTDIGWKWRARGSGAQMEFDPNGNGAFLAGFQVAPINTWVNLAVTYEGPGGSIKFYKNGELDGTTPIQSGNFRLLSHKNKIVLGSGNGADAYLDGDLSNFMMYNTVLSGNQIKQNYNAYVGRFK